MRIVVIILVLVGGGIYYLTYYLTQVQNKEPKPIGNSTQVTSPTVKNNKPLLSPTFIPSASQEQQKKFQSAQYKFSLFYPSGWDYKENDPLVPNLAEYTITFSSPDQNTGLDVWIRSGNWADVERDVLKEKNAVKGTVAGQPAIVQSQGNYGKVTFVKHPTITGKVLVFTSIGENLDVASQIQQTLKFE